MTAWTPEEQSAYANLNWLITVIDDTHPDFGALHDWYCRLSDDGAPPPTRRLMAQIAYRCDRMREYLRNMPKESG